MPLRWTDWGDGTGMAPAKPKDGFDVIPMWVADMNFATVPTIPEAIINRAKHPCTGIFCPETNTISPLYNGRKNEIM